MFAGFTLHDAPLRLLVLAASLLEAAFLLWLSMRQIAHVRSHRGRVPAAFAEAISLPEHQRAADYARDREHLAMLRTGWGWLIQAAWLLDGIDLLAGWVLGGSGPATPSQLPWRSALLVLAWALCGTLLDLPLSLYATFGIEQRYGFNRTRLPLWIVDRLRSLMLGLLIGLPLLLAGFWLMMHATGPWWFYAWVGLVGLMLAAPGVYVRFIAPRFNRFTPLADGALKDAILSLLQRCGLRAASLSVMDASRRSSHGNAYFIGFGPSKRIVLFDTLIDGSPPAEVQAVIAHELGHLHHRHVITGMVRSAAILLVTLAIFGWLSRQPWLIPAFGWHHQAPALSLLACLFLTEVLSPLSSVISNWISRRHEFEADAFARSQSEPGAMEAALIRLARNNAGTLTPDPLYALYHFSHPPVPLRVAHLKEAEFSNSLLKLEVEKAGGVI